MKPFGIYQYLEGEEMTDRDTVEAGSKFWNKNKWDNFVLPLLPDDCSELTLVDIGCNKGLFLYLAEQKGFKKVVGVDSNQEAVDKGITWRDEHNGKYEFICKRMEECIDDLPVSDYTLLVNTHYYFTINDWLDFIDKLQYKTRHVIIVTTVKKVRSYCWALAGVNDLRRYYKTWEEVGFIDELPIDGDPMPRRLWSLCFQSPYIERMDIEDVKVVNKVQNGFYAQLDTGMDYHDTDYYKYLYEYRKSWSSRRLQWWVKARIKVYEDVKKYGLKRPLYIDHRSNIVLDGNHRYHMMEHLGHKTIMVRKT